MKGVYQSIVKVQNQNQFFLFEEIFDLSINILFGMIFFDQVTVPLAQKRVLSIKILTNPVLFHLIIL